MADGARVQDPEVGEAGQSAALGGDQPALGGVLDDAGGGSGVLEDPAGLEGGGGRVDGDRDEAGRPGGEVEQGPLVGRTGHEGEAVAGPQARGDQPLGDGVDFGREAGGRDVGPGAVGGLAPEDDGGRVLAGVVVGDVGERTVCHAGDERGHGGFPHPAVDDGH
jgi:hypothetical protein